MPRLQAANNAETTLSQNISASATSFNVASGATFPDAPFLITVDDEIMEVGAKSGNTFSSVLRGREGTAASTHDSGEAVENRLTAASYNELATEAAVDMHTGDNTLHLTPAERAEWNNKMPTSGGVLANYREKLTTVSESGGSVNLSLGNVFTHSPSGNPTYSISNAVSGQAHSFTLIINQGATVRTLTFPASVKWQGGEVPDLTTANKTYILTFLTINGGTTWLGMFGGEF